MAVGRNTGVFRKLFGSIQNGGIIRIDRKLRKNGEKSFTMITMITESNSVLITAKGLRVITIYTIAVAAINLLS